jgi:hypothetical protein
MSLRESVTAGALYAGVMMIAGVAAGEGLNVQPQLISGLAMAAATMLDDWIHAATEMDQSNASSAVVTGGVFAGIQAVRGERSSVVRNVAAGAATSIVMDMYVN